MVLQNCVFDDDDGHLFSFYSEISLNPAKSKAKQIFVVVETIFFFVVNPWLGLFRFMNCVCVYCAIDSIQIFIFECQKQNNKTTKIKKRKIQIKDFLESSEYFLFLAECCQVSKIVDKIVEKFLCFFWVIFSFSFFVNV